jgi:gliding motility-associated-like protein
MMCKWKLVIASVGLSFLLQNPLFSQSSCSPVVVKEAVRNGDFELGYLSGPVGGKHTFVVGSDYDFYSDFDFVGSVPAYPTAACTYGIGDKYAIMRAENYTCSSTNNWTNKGYWGPDYIGGGGTFADHTPGKAGKGFCYIADLNVRTISPLTGGKPIAWAQTVDIVPSQNYYFSAWLANYNTSGNAPVMQVTIIPYRQSDGGADPAVTLPAVGSPTGTMNWIQISSNWTPAGVYNKATIRLEFTNTAGGGSGLDVAIDDISFINSCQALSANTSPEFGYDTTSVCGYASGNVTLNANYPSPQSSNASYYWFEGTGTTQTAIAVPTTQQTYTTNKPGTYRVCVQDPDNGCAVNDIVVVNAAYTTSVPSATLCNPATANLNATPTPSGGSPTTYAWTVPSGATNPGNASTATATVGGAYSVVVTGPAYNGGTCSASASNTVSSSLPTAPTNLTFCSGGGTATSLTLADGKKYTWYTNAAGTTPINGTVAASNGTSVSWTPSVGTTTNQTLYLVNAETSPLATLQTNGWSYETQPNAMTINVTQAVLLKSLQVQVAGWVGATTITINVTGSQTLSYTQAIAAGSSQTVNCNFLLTPGTYSINYTRSGAFLVTTMATTSAPGVSISGTNVGFQNMVFESSQACAPIPVVVQAISCCTPPTITTPPTNQTTCVNVATSPGFSVSATGTSLTYQWQESTDNGATFTNISGATSATYAPTPTATSWTGRRYRALVYTGGTCPATSTAGILTVNAATAITTQPTATTTLCSGASYSISVVGTGTGTLTYQWKLNGSDISGANSATYSIGSITTAHAGTYTVDVTGSCGTVTSANAVLNVNDVSITTSPTNQGTCTGGNVTFSAVASGVATLSYQWQLSTNGGGSFADISGATSASLAVNSVTIGMNNYQYRVVARSNGACAVTSSAATLTVNASTTINTQPAVTTSVCAPTGFTLSVSASGSGTASYVWYKDNVAIPSSNVSSYVVATSSAADAGVYKVDVTTSCGTTTSNNATVSVNETSITTQPTAQSTCVNGSVSFSVVAGGIATLGYQWQVNSGSGFSNVAGATSSTLALSSVTAGMNNNQYQVIITSNGLCPLTSNAVALTVNAATTLNTQPSGTTVCEPAGFTLTAAASGSGTVTYQWYKNGSIIGGATSATYTLASTTVADAGSYTVQANSNCGLSSMSNAAVVVVQTAATTTPNVTGNEACSGSASSVSVQNTQAGVSYQAFIGATSVSSSVAGTGGTITLNIAGASLSAGSNTITVQAQGCNTVNLSPATILVLDAPGTISGLTSVCNNAKSSVTYSIAAVTGASSYTWTVSNGGSINSGQNTASINAAIAASPTTISVQPRTAAGLTCTSSSTTVAIVSDYQFTDALVASATNVCSGVPVTISVTNPSADSYTNWTVPSGSTLQSTTATSAVVVFGATAGAVTVQPVHQCNAGLSVLSTSLTVIPVPVANAGPDQQLDAIRPVTLDGSNSSQSVNYSYVWTSNPASTIQNATSLITTANPNALSTNYTLTVSVPGLPGCSSSDQLNVLISFEVIMPNAFSPNGDGIHDELIAKNIEYFPDAELIIYNQWGEVVFQTKDVFENPWDGKRNGSPVPVTAYYYVLKLNVSGYKDLSGDINVLR